MAGDEVAELYGLPLDEFVKGRDALARELRKAGERDRAADIAKLKRPTVAAWTVNQLARRNRKDLDLLLDAGHRLRTSQVEAVGSGDQTTFEQARRDHERAIRTLVADARTRDDPSDATLASVERTLRYASIDDEHRPALASGTLTTEVEAPGFGAFTGMALPSAPPPSAGKKAAKSDSAGDRRARVAAAEDALKQARADEREARETLRDAERTERKAAQAHERAGAALAAAQEAAEAAAAAAEEAAEAVKAARAGK